MAFSPVMNLFLKDVLRLGRAREVSSVRAASSILRVGRRNAVQIRNGSQALLRPFGVDLDVLSGGEAAFYAFLRGGC